MFNSKIILLTDPIERLKRTACGAPGWSRLGPSYVVISVMYGAATSHTGRLTPGSSGPAADCTTYSVTLNAVQFQHLSST